MEDTEEKKQDVFKLPIQGEMTIYQASELKLVLLDALQKGPTLEVDLSAVSEIDTAGVQLLMMLKKAAQQSQREVLLSGHSPAVLEVFELADLAGYFGDPLVIQALDKASSGRSSARHAND